MTLPETYLIERIEYTDSCWIWYGARDRRGYGQIARRGQTVMAHRVLYELFNGPIPKGFQIDHLCKNTSCVNPDHLEAVTPRENTLRSTALTAVHAAKTHCSEGHELTPDNLYPSVTHPTWRICKQCSKDNQAKYLASKKERIAV